MTCTSRTWSPSTASGSGGDADDEAALILGEPAVAHLDRGINDPRNGDLLLTELDLAAADARHVQQVVDQVQQMVELALHDLQRLFAGGGVTA